MGADDAGQFAEIEFSKLLGSERTVQALYECAPNGTKLIIPTNNYKGDEDALIEIFDRHLALLWPEDERTKIERTQNTVFQHARAAAQRVDDSICFTLAYLEDFSQRKENIYPERRVGTVAYLLSTSADSRPTSEHETVKLFADHTRLLIRAYNMSSRLFSSQPGYDERLFPEFGRVQPARGYEKLIILDDLISEEQKIATATPEEEDSDFQLFDEATLQTIHFPEKRPQTDRHATKKPNPQHSSPGTPPKKTDVTAKPKRLSKIDLSSLVPLNVPLVLEEKNPVFDKLFMHVTHLHGEYEAGQVEADDRLRDIVYTLNELCFNTQTGKDGNLCYIITPKSLEALRTASLEWAHITHLATAYGRIAMRARSLWQLEDNARAITDQRDVLAQEVRTLRQTTQGIEPRIQKARAEGITQGRAAGSDERRKAISDTRAALEAEYKSNISTLDEKAEKAEKALNDLRRLYGTLEAKHRDQTGQSERKYTEISAEKEAIEIERDQLKQAFNHALAKFKDLDARVRQAMED